MNEMIGAPWMLSEPELRKLRVELNEAIAKYSQYPANAKASLAPQDFARFYVLFRCVVEKNEYAMEHAIEARQLAETAMNTNRKAVRLAEEANRVAIQLNKEVGNTRQSFDTWSHRYKGEIAVLQQEILALKRPNAKAKTASPLSKAEQRRRKAPKYRRDHAPLSVRSLHCLDQEFGHQEWTAFDVITKTESELLRTPNFGRKSLKEVTDWLRSLRLKWA